MRKPLIWIATALALTSLVISYSHLTAFQPNPLTQTTPPPQKTPMTAWAVKLDEAERLRSLDPNHSDPVFQAIDEAQQMLFKAGKEREALLLYPRKMFVHGALTANSEDPRAAFVRDSVCAVLEQKGQATQDTELLLAKWYIELEQAGMDDRQADAEALFAKIEGTALPQHWGLVAAAYVCMLNTFSDYCETPKLLDYQHRLESLVQAHASEIADKSALVQQHFFYCDWFYSYLEIGRHYAYTYQDYETAFSYYERSIEELYQRPYVDSLWISTIYHVMASTYSRKGDLDKMREYYEKAVSMVVQRHPHAFSDYYHHIAQSHLDQHNPELALPFLLESHRYNERVKDSDRLKPYRFLYTWIDLVITHTDLGNQEEAQYWMQRMDSLSALYPPDKIEDYGDDQAERLHFARAYFHHHFGQYAEAEKYYQLSADAYTDFHGGVHDKAYTHWGQMELEQGRPEKALPLFQKALYANTKQKPSSEVDNPTLDQIVYKHSTLKPAIQKLEALRLLLASGKANDVAAYQKSSRELADLGIALLESVVNSFEREGSSKKLIETAYQLYDGAIEVYLELYQQENKPEYAEKAFELAERSKSILLMGALREENALQFAGIPDSLLNKEHILNNNIAFYEQQVHLAQLSKNATLEKQQQGYLFEAKKGLDELKKGLEKDYPQYFQLKYQQKFSTVAELQQKLGDTDLLVEYFEGKNNLYVFAIHQQEGLKVYTLPLPRDYKQQINAFQRNLSDFNWIKEHEEESRQQFIALSSQFFNNYVKPALVKTPGRLIVVADGLLNYIPFEILLTETPDAQLPYSEMPYLIQQTAINYHYSATLWATATASKQKAAHSLLAFAANYPPAEQQAPEALRSPSSLLRKTLTPLEGARKEVETLEAHWDGTFCYDNQANETFFKRNADQYSILHLAMHGLVNAKNPDYSSLAFTEDSDSTDDDFLHTNEIKRMRLNADLVVLSACETGYGKYQRGEGVVSLGRSFLYAGAASMVMSLWAVNDASTAHIMEHFYQELHNGKSKSEALRQAKLQYLQQTKGIAAHPAYWTPFVLLGSDAQVDLPKAGGGWYGWALGAVAVLGLGWMVAMRRRG